MPTIRNPIVEGGATIPELSIMFAMDPRDVRARLKEVKSDGIRNELSYWSIRNAAPCLMPIDEKDAAVVSRILRMNSNALPAVLKKEYWAGRLAELNVLEKQGDLWSTKAVVDLASDVFKTMRLSLTLLGDALERETGLTENQRALITHRIAAVMDELREKLIDDLRTSRSNSSGKTFAQEEAGEDEDL